MDIIQGGAKIKIAGATIGEHVLVYLVTGKVERIILCAVTKLGIEGTEVDLLTNPLTFYPFTAIIKVKKIIEDNK